MDKDTCQHDWEYTPKAYVPYRKCKKCGEAQTEVILRDWKVVKSGH